MSGVVLPDRHASTLMRVLACEIKGRYRELDGNVPYVIKEKGGIQYAICYMGQGKPEEHFFRVYCHFTEKPSLLIQQTTFNLPNRQTVIEFFTEPDIIFVDEEV